MSLESYGGSQICVWSSKWRSTWNLGPEDQPDSLSHAKDERRRCST
jgi:hypothetical protein